MFMVIMMISMMMFMMRKGVKKKPYSRTHFKVKKKKFSKILLRKIPKFSVKLYFTISEVLNKFAIYLLPSYNLFHILQWTSLLV